MHLLLWECSLFITPKIQLGLIKRDLCRLRWLTALIIVFIFKEKRVTVVSYSIRQCSFLSFFFFWRCCYETSISVKLRQCSRAQEKLKTDLFQSCLHFKICTMRSSKAFSTLFVRFLQREYFWLWLEKNSLSC